MTAELEQRLDDLANTIAALPKYGQAETPRALDAIREDITDLRAELQAVKTAPRPPQGVSVAQVEQKLNKLGHTMMTATAGAVKERLQVTEKRIDEVAEDARRHTDGSLADIRADSQKALMGIGAASTAGVAAIRALLKIEV